MEHALVPEFRVLSEEEKRKLLEKFRITEEKLPKILEADPVVKKIEAKKGDILEIKRTSGVAGKSTYYRIVVRS